VAELFQFIFYASFVLLLRMQQLSIAVQRGNAVCITTTADSSGSFNDL